MNIMHIVSIICFALCLIIFFYLKWYIKRRTSVSGMVDEYRAEVYKLIAEIDKVTDRDSQLVEERINKLKVILHDVDKRIALYENELEQNRQKSGSSNETLYTSLGRGIRAALETPAPVQPSPAAQLSFDLPVIPPRPLVPAPVVQSPAPVIMPAAEPSTPDSVKKAISKKQIRTHIDMMLSEGLSAEEIASSLEISIAEVNLAMNLRRTKDDT